MGLEELDMMSPKVREKYLEIIRAIPPGRKIEITVAFCDTVREFVMDVIRSENPDASEEFILAEFRKRILPEELRRKVYGA
ncbi:MAG: hypothetical protein M1335_05515 [Chloroflexi bacterium]|nr:hypothetical protein [Chloroflexota bacterium]